VVDHGGMLRLDAEALDEARVTHVFLLQNFDGNLTKDYFILGQPNLTHAPDCDSADELITTTKQLVYLGLHFRNTASITFLAIGAASEFPRPA
jgi:hypothetical protein